MECPVCRETVGAKAQSREDGPKLLEMKLRIVCRCRKRTPTHERMIACMKCGHEVLITLKGKLDLAMDQLWNLLEYLGYRKMENGWWCNGCTGIRGRFLEKED